MNRQINHNKQNGFTLLEALVASVILSAVVISIAAISNKSITQTKLNQQTDLAWQVIDQQFTRISSEGIDNYMLTGETQGSLEIMGQPFIWQLEFIPETLGNLYTIQMNVQWQFQNQARQISASTMMNGLATTATSGPIEGAT